MMNTPPRRNDVICLTFGGVFLLLGPLWLWSLQKDFPLQLRSAFSNPFLIALCVASVIAAGWLSRRYRGRDQSVSADLPALGKEREPRRAADYETLRWLIRLGCVASGVLLAGLLIGNLAAVIITVALAEVVIAFVLIVLLVPRGL